MSIQRLHATQRLAIQPDEAWRFFSDPRNLAVITPPGMRFRLTSNAPEAIHAGLMLTYRLTPLPPVPLRATWLTEITHVEVGRRFVDEQRVGPYSLWHHEHGFAAVPGGTEVIDDIWYVLPGGPLGDLAHRLMVRGQLQRIFTFRRRILAARFGDLDAHRDSIRSDGDPESSQANPPGEGLWTTPSRP